MAKHMSFKKNFCSQTNGSWYLDFGKIALKAFNLKHYQIDLCFLQVGYRQCHFIILTKSQTASDLLPW